MNPLKPSVMIPQIKDFPKIIREHIEPWGRMIQGVLTKDEAQALNCIFITGDGDSFHASHSAEMAFHTIAGVPCEPLSAQRFLNYKVEWLPVYEPGRTLVIGVSASGTTRRLIDSLERANARGAITIGLTGRQGSALTKVANRVICVDLPAMGPAPGMRSYIGSLLGLYLFAIRIGELRDNLNQEEIKSLYKELSNLSEVMDATIGAVEEPARDAAEALKASPILVFIGSGPSYGTAIFSAAKVVEAAGVFSVGQDLEEWTHVEFFAYPTDTPTFIIAPPGKSHWRAIDLADMAKNYGRRVVVVVKKDDHRIIKHADFVLPVIGNVREEFSPLVYHIAVDFFACFLTESVGRHLFQSDNMEFQAYNRRYLARDRI